MTAGRWGRVPRILAGPAAASPVLATALGVSFIDQKRAAVRDWLDDREVAVLDPEELRGVLLGAELLAEETRRAARQGLVPPAVAHLIASMATGLVVVLEPYLPEEARHG